MRNKIIIGCVACALVFGAGGFFGGMKYQQSKSLAGGRGMMGDFPGQAVSGNAGTSGANTKAIGNGGGMSSGEVVSKDSGSLTIKTQNGGSKIILLSSSTQIQKMAEASLDEVIVGNQVVVSGTTNSDGSITAKSIQLKQNAQPVPSESK